MRSAVVEPACDVGSVHRFLRHRGVAGAKRAVDPGLSGLVEAQLGSPLDKTQQCSGWGERPLTPAQRAYAAADAACLLGLLGSLLAAVGQPEQWPMVEAPEGGTADGSGNDDGSPADAAAPPHRGAAALPAAPDGQQAAEGGQPAGASLLGGCTLQQLRGAAAAWGVRLEISGERAVRRSSRRSGKGRRQQRAAAAAARRGPLPAGCSGFPAAVPWMDDQRRVSQQWPKACLHLNERPGFTPRLAAARLTPHPAARPSLLPAVPAVQLTGSPPCCPLCALCPPCS
jgi:hypothetical protein